MDVSEIVDQETLAAWLEETKQPREAGVWLASRAAARVLPLAWDSFESATVIDVSAIPVIRCVFAAGLGNPAVYDAIGSLAIDSARSANRILFEGDFAGFAAEQATSAAAFALGTSISHAVGAAAISSANYVLGSRERVFWGSVRKDCSSLGAGHFPIETGLWPEVGSYPLNGADGPFSPTWNPLVKRLRSHANLHGEETARGGDALDWSFWIDWYEDILHGRPRNEALDRDVALEVDWDQPAAHVLDQIEGIRAKYAEEDAAEVLGDETAMIDVFRATLFDFTYDHAEGVMRAIPLSQDWKHLEDPALLAAFQADADELKDDLNLFCKALAAEGTAMQGAGIVRTYVNAILSELARADEVRRLRVGKLMQYGRLIEEARLNEDTKREFGLLAPALESNGQAVLDLMRNHFARTLSRFADLREIGIEEDATHWEVLQGIRDLVRLIRVDDNPQRAPLAKEDAAVLEDIADSIERQMRAMDGSTTDDLSNSITREVNFGLAKLGATIAIFNERTVGLEAKAGGAADISIKWQKRGLGLLAIVDGLKRAFQ